MADEKAQKKKKMYTRVARADEWNSKKVGNRKDRSQSNAVADTLPTGDNGRESRSY